MKMMMILKDLHLLLFKNMMMILKCYGGQACAEITQAGTGPDAVRETIPISDGSGEI